MPCDQIQLQSIRMENAQNHLDILADALKAEGYQVSSTKNSLSFYKSGVRGSYSNGSFNVTDGFDIDSVKQQFGKQVVRVASKRYGWAIRENGNKLTITKRV